MSISELKAALVFSLPGGRLSDSQQLAFPNYNCSSPTVIETESDSSIKLKLFQSNVPAIDSQSGAFLVNPARSNLVTHNLNLTHALWEKGSSVLVKARAAQAPDGSERAARISFGAGVGTNQIIRRTFSLNAGVNHCNSVLLRLAGGTFGNNDVMRITDVATNAILVEYGLKELNKWPAKYRACNMSFKTTGAAPTIPQVIESSDTTGFAISSVTGGSFVLSSPTPLINNQLVGAFITFNGIGGSWEVVSNTATPTGGLTSTITVSNATLVASGVSSASLVKLTTPPKRNTRFEIYCETPVSIDWGGMQLEVGTDRTPIFYQDAEIIPITASSIVYRAANNPLSYLFSSSLYLELEEWSGNGSLLEIGNLSIFIANGFVSVRANNTVLTSTVPLPRKSASIFVRISNESARLSLYQNRVLVAQTSLAGFIHTRAPITIDSTGLRLVKRLLIFNRSLDDGAVAIGEQAGSDIGSIFNDQGDSVVTVSNVLPEFALPAVLIPASEQPAATSTITTINSAGRAVTLLSGTGFEINTSVIIQRDVGGSILNIGFAIISGKSGDVLTLDTIFGMSIGDICVSQYVARPGNATVRFPFDPIDAQRILAIDANNKRVTVASALAFTKNARSVVQTQEWQDVGEPIVNDVDTVNNLITLSSVVGLAVGDIISQPESGSEVNIPTRLYNVRTASTSAGIGVSYKATNGFNLSNSGPEAVSITPIIQVAM